MDTPLEIEFLSSEVPAVYPAAVASAAEAARAAVIGIDLNASLRALRRPEILFLRYLTDRGRYAEHHADAMQLLGRAIGFHNSTNGLQKLLYGLYQEHFVQLNNCAVSAFQKAVGGQRLLVVHMSCLSRLSKAKDSARTFDDSTFFNLIIVGDDSRDSYEFDDADNILRVPASDLYEGLAQKAAAVYKFLAFSGLNKPLLKVDDDVSCVAPFDLGQIVVPKIQAHDYLGRVWSASEAGFSRWWHVGKCADAMLNEEPYSLAVDALYAEGPAYGLSSRAVHILGKASVYLKGQFAAEASYEDLAVGKVLNFYGIKPLPFDLIAEHILTSNDPYTRDPQLLWRTASQ